MIIKFLVMQNESGKFKTFSTPVTLYIYLLYLSNVTDTIPKTSATFSNNNALCPTLIAK